MDWVFILQITMNQGSLVSQRMTEAQCRAAVSVYEQQADPVMAYCFGPKGQKFHTSGVRERLQRYMVPPTKPDPKPKAASKQEL